MVSSEGGVVMPEHRENAAVDKCPHGSMWCPDCEDATDTDDGLILDLFAGPGGWSEGLRMLGLADVGIEWDDAACRTRAAAGHLTIRADVASYPPQPFAGKVEGLIASPPCQDFSLAGKQAGRTGEKGQLIDTVPYWVAATSPRWVACEQVPPALPIWREHADLYRRLGYSVWCGVLNAANYGVPQTRKRAFLLASLDGTATAPEPTHAKDPQEGLFGRQLPWVTMAQALGWGFDDPSATVSAGGTETGGAEPFGNAGYRRRLAAFVSAGVTGEGRPKDPQTQPADTLTGKGTACWITGQRRDSGPGAERTPRGIHQPSYTIRANGSGMAPAGVEWIHERPATTVVGSFRPDIISAPGYRTEVSRQDAEGGVRVTVAEGGVLQSFPADYPWQGSRSKQYQQVGNAVPPLLAAHVVGSLLGIGLPGAVAA